MADEPIRAGNGVWSLRILDGVPGPSPAPNYILIPHVQFDFSGELRSPRPEDTILLNGGVIDPYAATVPGGDIFLAQGVPYTFSFLLFRKTGKAILQAMSNTLEEDITTDTWVVGAGVFTNAAGTGVDIKNSAGAATPPIQTADNLHMRVHVEMLQVAQGGGDNFGFRMEECHFDSVVPTVQEVSSPTRCSFRRFGKLTVITAFTTGTDLTPSIA